MYCALAPKFARLLLLAAGLAAAPGFAGETAPAAATATAEVPATTLIWRGDLATERALMDDLAGAFRKATPHRLELQPFSTISGIDETLAGKADLAGSARPAFARRKAEAGLTFVPVAWDALVMIVHPDNRVDNISLEDLRKVYYGKIDNWSRLGGPDRSLHLYSVASPLDGIEFSLRQYLFGRGNQPVASPRLYINTAQLEAAVSLDPAALAVSTLSSVIGNDKLAMLEIEGHAPTPANVADGSYPLYIPLYLARAPNNPDAAAIDAFFAFLDTETARRILLDHHVLPYETAVGLAVNHEQHLADVLALAREPRNGPVAAPGATYSARVGVAPKSELTAAAQARLAEKREEAAAKQAAAKEDEAAKLPTED